MKKYYYLLIACLSLLTVQAQKTKSTTHEYPLTDIDYKNLPSWIDNDYGVWKHLAPQDQYRFTDEGIVITKKKLSAGGFAITDLNLDLSKGAKFEFEYAMAVVTGTDAQGGKYGGGGMTFFIYDADEKFEMGYIGSALGYSFNGETTGGSTAVKTGLNGGYLGIGFDLDGNNKERKGFGMQSYETREGLSHLRYINAGFDYEFIEFDFGKKVFNDYYKNHITLRGAVQNSGKKGNPLLLTKYFGGKDSSKGIAMATLDYDDGEYDFSSTNNGDDFDISDGGFDYKPNFQKIEVELVPDGEKGMYVTVKGNGKMLIDRFYYKHSFKTYGDGKGKDGDYVDYEYNYSSDIPDRVNIGFVGTTMNEDIQMTIIRNLKVTPGDEDGGGEEGEVLDDEYEEICVSDTDATVNEGAATYINILEDTDYDVDWSSFRFEDKNGVEIGKDSYRDYYAKWEYDRYDRQVKMTVTFDDYDPGDTLEVYYSVEIDGVRSKPANITVKGIACGAVVNPHIRSKAGEK
ncbi:hypothetical protein [Myroides sp.]|uniref:hypothetical protein n=1 Tax=Myroides sp. TaxID=1874736 RepID=UPI003F380C54